MSGRVDVDALAQPAEGYVVAEGDAHKVAPTRHHFAAIVAGLMTAREYLFEVESERDRLVGRVRELEAAAKVCPTCGHEWSRHDPEDGMCDAHSDEDGVFGPCRCGREVTFTQDANIRLSRAALGGDA